MKPRPFFILVGLLAVLYLASAGLTVFREEKRERDPAATPSWGARAEALLSQRLEPGDVSAALPADCRAQLGQGAFVLAPGTSCTLVVKETKARVRSLELELVEGFEAQVSVDSTEENRLDVELTLGGDHDRQAKVQLYRQGGTLEIACPSVGIAQPCRVEVR